MNISIEKNICLKQNKQEKIDGQKIRISLVEDNKINQTLARGISTVNYFSANIANHGEEAITMRQQIYEQTPYHLILVDCPMSVMDVH